MSFRLDATSVSYANGQRALNQITLAASRGEPIAEVPATWRDRTAGQSRFRLWKWLPRYLRWYCHALCGHP